MKTVLVHLKGLMEYEGREWIEIWGKGEGNNLKEVCLDIVSKNPDKAKYLDIVDESVAFDWGMKLQLLTED